MCPEISFLWQIFCLTSVTLHMNVTNGYVKTTLQFPQFKAQEYMKCNDNVKHFRVCIHITLNTERCFITSCKQLIAEMEKFECLQVSGRAARFGLPAEPASPHIAYETYPYYSRCWKCSVLLSGEQMKPGTNFKFFFSFTPENPNSYHEVRANLYTKPILL